MPNTRARVIILNLTPPSLRDNTADADRLLAELKRIFNLNALTMDLQQLKSLPAQLRRWRYRVRCAVMDDGQSGVVVAVTEAGDATVLAGVAVDLGTSRVVVRLLDLQNGAVLAGDAFDNPQIEVGTDILTRIHFAETGRGLAKLKDLIVLELNQTIEQLCDRAAIGVTNVVALALAGNTAMTHLFLGLDPHGMIREPYIPAANVLGLYAAGELGLTVGAHARAYIFPNIGSYFGGDLMAGILTAGLHRREDTAILVDVGTNAEVVLGNRNWLIACAGAAGPALEGGVTRMGMMAAPGVIDRVRIDRQSGRWEIHTIGDRPALGICGSGLIDLAAQLFLNGILDIRGKFQPGWCPRRCREIDGMVHLTVVVAAESGTGRDLTISQADIDSLIRSKAAMFTILETITQTVGIDFADLSRFYVAGTFGAFIDPRAAITLGMLPDLEMARFKSIGNSSLAGATAVLVDRRRMVEIDLIRSRITYLELNVNQDFMNRFSAAKFIPHTDASRFPSVASAPPEMASSPIKGSGCSIGP